MGTEVMRGPIAGNPGAGARSSTGRRPTPVPAVQRLATPGAAVRAMTGLIAWRGLAGSTDPASAPRAITTPACRAIESGGLHRSLRPRQEFLGPCRRVRQNEAQAVLRACGFDYVKPLRCRRKSFA